MSPDPTLTPPKGTLICFEFTGEVRRPRKGEWYLGESDIIQSSYDRTAPFPILRRLPDVGPVAKDAMSELCFRWTICGPPLQEFLTVNRVLALRALGWPGEPQAKGITPQQIDEAIERLTAQRDIRDVFPIVVRHAKALIYVLVDLGFLRLAPEPTPEPAKPAMPPEDKRPWPRTVRDMTRPRFAWYYEGPHDGGTVIDHQCTSLVTRPSTQGTWSSQNFSTTSYKRDCPDLDGVPLDAIQAMAQSGELWEPWEYRRCTSDGDDFLCRRRGGVFQLHYATAPCWTISRGLDWADSTPITTAEALRWIEAHGPKPKPTVYCNVPIREEKESPGPEDEEDRPKMAPVKPPLGLIPRFIADEQRLAEVEAAITRYNNVGKAVPVEWLSERAELTKSLAERASKPAPDPRDAEIQRLKKENDGLREEAQFQEDQNREATARGNRIKEEKNREIERLNRLLANIRRDIGEVLP